MRQRFLNVLFFCRSNVKWSINNESHCIVKVCRNMTHRYKTKESPNVSVSFRLVKVRIILFPTRAKIWIIFIVFGGITLHINQPPTWVFCLKLFSGLCGCADSICHFSLVCCTCWSSYTFIVLKEKACKVESSKAYFAVYVYTVGFAAQHFFTPISTISESLKEQFSRLGTNCFLVNTLMRRSIPSF